MNSVAADLPVVRHPFTVIAHRGDHTQAPENSLAAVENAILAGADYVEIDVRRTRDGRHVLLHDATVDRTTYGRGRLAELTLDEVRRLRLRDVLPESESRHLIPTLQEALGLCRGRIHVYLDFKDGDREEVIRELQAAGMSKSVVVYCQLADAAAWRRAAPDLPLIISPSAEVARDPRRLADWVTTHRVEVLDGDWTVYSAESVAAAQAAGARVWPDIQKSGEDRVYWLRVVALGFSGVQTDAPGALIRWLGETGRR